jgi:hypothetical protein
MTNCAVYKSLTAEFLDDYYSGDATPLEEAYQSALALLEAHASDPLSATTTDLNESGTLPRDVGNTDEFDAYWLSDTSQLAGKEVDRVLRHGYLEAIRIAQTYETPVPIETFWVTGAGDNFEVHICSGKRRVTVFMFIPKPRRYGSTRSDTASLVVRVGGLRDDEAVALDDGNPPIVRVQVSGSRRLES